MVVQQIKDPRISAHSPRESTFKEVPMGRFNVADAPADYLSVFQDLVNVPLLISDISDFCLVCHTSGKTVDDSRSPRT